MGMTEIGNGDFRVLYATDGSPSALAAMELLVQNFDPRHVAVIDILHVIAPPLGLAPVTSGASAVTLEAHEQAADAVVAEATDTLREHGFATTAKVSMGNPAGEILALADELSPDLILVGSRGLSGVRRMLSGSVASKVAQYAHTSVLITHRGDRIGHVLVGHDGSPGADACLRLLARLPLEGSPRVTVAAAFDVLAPLRSGVAPLMQNQVDAAFREDLAAAEAHAHATAAEGAAVLAATWKNVEARHVHGLARHVLATLAIDVGAELIVIGSRGLPALERFLLGSTSASLVAQPPTNVLVVR